MSWGEATAPSQQLCNPTARQQQSKAHSPQLHQKSNKSCAAPQLYPYSAKLCELTALSKQSKLCLFTSLMIKVQSFAIPQLHRNSWTSPQLHWKSIELCRLNSSMTTINNCATRQLHYNSTTIPQLNQKSIDLFHPTAPELYCLLTATSQQPKHIWPIALSQTYKVVPVHSGIKKV